MSAWTGYASHEPIHERFATPPMRPSPPRRFLHTAIVRDDRELLRTPLIRQQEFDEIVGRLPQGVPYPHSAMRPLARIAVPVLSIEHDANASVPQTDRLRIGEPIEKLRASFVPPTDAFPPSQPCGVHEVVSIDQEDSHTAPDENLAATNTLRVFYP